MNESWGWSRKTTWNTLRIEHLRIPNIQWEYIYMRMGMYIYIYKHMGIIFICIYIYIYIYIHTWGICKTNIHNGNINEGFHMAGGTPK